MNHCGLSAGPGGSQPLVNPFMDPKMWEKVSTDSRTKNFMADPEYRKLIQEIQRDPTQLG